MCNSLLSSGSIPIFCRDEIWLHRFHPFFFEKIKTYITVKIEDRVEIYYNFRKNNMKEGIL